jgi:hypothetical protein
MKKETKVLFLAKTYQQNLPAQNTAVSSMLVNFTHSSLRRMRTCLNLLLAHAKSVSQLDVCPLLIADTLRELVRSSV